MKKKTLVIMAAGLGSRFGAGAGKKQVTPVDDAGHLIIDYSIYDAIRAGFEKVVFVIKPESRDMFHEAIGKRVEKHVEIAYAYQTLEKYLPEGFYIPEGREKPWGTGHAALCARNEVEGAFVVINADDFYGRDAFETAARFIDESDSETEHAMVGYALRNTMTPFGSVARGVCTTDEGGNLISVVERTKIEARGEDAAFTEDGETWTPISGDTTVSLNLWVFKNSIFNEMQARFAHFVNEEIKDNPLKKEYYLPSVSNQLLSEKKASFKVLTTKARWFGMTYLEDLPNTKANIAQMKENGEYPVNLWERR